MKLSPQAAADRFDFGHQCAVDAALAERNGEDDDASDFVALALMTAKELRSAGYGEYAQAIEGIIQ